MKWISDKKLIAPFLFGISFAISCIPTAVLLYLTFKKDDKTEDDNDKRSQQITKFNEARLAYDMLKETSVFTSYGIMPLIESSCNKDINYTSETLEVDEALLPEVCPLGSIIIAFVLAMETPNEFWIHVIGRNTTKYLGNLLTKMTEYYDEVENRKIHALETVIPGQMVAAKFKNFKNKFKFFDDTPWHRARVINVLENSRCEVFYVDYGEVDIISMNDILELPADIELSLSFQAVKCSLANIKPCGNEWSSDARNKFAYFVGIGQFRPVFAEIKGYKYHKGISNSPWISCVELYWYIEGKNIGSLHNIGEFLKRSKLAEFEKDVYFTANS